MKHRFTIIAAMAAMLGACLTTQAQTSISYSTGNMGRSTVFRCGATPLQGLAIKLSHDKLQTLKGQTIGSLEIAFGSRNTTNKQATVFMTNNLNGEDILDQDVTIAAANKWQTIQLDAPYTITGDEEELYIGYMAEIPTTYSMLQSDFASDTRDCTYAWKDNQWVDIYGMGFGNANIRAIVNDKIAFTDVILKEIDINALYHKAGEEYNYSCELFNFGTETINSLQITMQVGDTERKIDYNDINIPQAGTFKIELPTLNSDQTGDMDVRVELSSINGKTEMVTDRTDDRFGASAFFYPAEMERSILVEEFTGMACVNCPNGKKGLESAIEMSQLPCVEIMHHSGYNADILSTDADWDYTMYYGSASTYAPACMINRLVNPTAGNVPVMNIGDALSSLRLAATRQPYVSLSLTSQYDETSKEATVEFNVLNHKELPGATLLNVYLIQDSIIGYQSGGGNDYVHNGVLRKVLTGNNWGLLLDENLERGSKQNWSTTFTLPESIYSDFWTPSLLNQAGYSADQVTIPTIAEHMRIVAFVANYDADNINNNMVYNCIEVPLINGSYTQAGMNSGTALETITDYTQTASQHIYDLNGRELGNAESLPAGIYIINGKKTAICK